MLLKLVCAESREPSSNGRELEPLEGTGLRVGAAPVLIIYSTNAESYGTTVMLLTGCISIHWA